MNRMARDGILAAGGDVADCAFLLQPSDKPVFFTSTAATAPSVGFVLMDEGTNETVAAGIILGPATGVD